MASLPLVTSFSRLSEYAGCPLRYRHLHVDGLKEPEVEPDWTNAPRIAEGVASPFDVVLGRVIHAVLRSWQAEVDGGAEADPDRLLAAAREGALAMGLDPLQVDRALRGDSVGLRRYASGPWPRRRTLFSEKPVRLQLVAADGFAADLGLRLDRVVEYRGATAILDFKSVPPHPLELRADRWQLRTYALAAAALRPRPPAPVRLFLVDVRRGRQVRVGSTRSLLDGARNRLLRSARGVAAGDFRVSGHPERPCWSCGFRLECPASLSPRPPGSRST